MDFFIPPSPILLSLLCISATYASPLDLAGFMINNTQTTGPQVPAADTDLTALSTIMYIGFLLLVGIYLLYKGCIGGSVGILMSTGIGSGLLATIICKFIETRYP